MHRLITDYTLVDHNNRNTLDNRKSNLKNASKSENNRNHKLRKDSTSGISGVNWDKNLVNGECVLIQILIKELI